MYATLSKFAVLLGLALATDMRPVDLIAAEQSELPPNASSFLRVIHDTSQKPRALETATVRFKREVGGELLTVDLVAAIHVADKSYFESLNDQFKKYDAVLFEMVKPAEPSEIETDPTADLPDSPDAFEPDTGESGRESQPQDRHSPAAEMLRQTQRMLKNALDLELQTEIIDYRAENFVHADLTQEKLRQLIEQDGGAMLLLWRLLVESVQHLNQDDGRTSPHESPRLDASLLPLLLARNGSVKLRELMAEELARTTGGLTLLPTLNRLLVQERNKAAATALERAIAAGHKNIAVFYGAAHMPDLEQRLKEQFGLKRTETTWHQAWDIQRPSKRSLFEGLLRSLGTNAR